MSTLSLAECKEELTEPHEYIKELTGEEMILFRPPYGDYNDTVIQAADECSYYTIQWDVDSLDWKNYTAGKERACEQNLGNVFCPHAVK